MSYLQAQTAKTLKPGDRVNKHNKEWLTVKKISKNHNTVIVAYIIGNPAFSNEEMIVEYMADELIERV